MQKPTYEKDKLRIVFSLSWLKLSKFKKIVYFNEEVGKGTEKGNYFGCIVYH